MSYPTHRPSSTTPQSNEPTLETHNSSSSQSHTGQSPLDWSNYMNFQTPPVPNASGNGIRQGYGNNDGRGSQDQYKAFAQGINMTRPSPSSMGFQHPYPGAGSPPRSQYPLKPSPLQHQMQLPLGHGHSPRQSSHGGKGKSPAHRDSNGQPHNDSNVNNGLTLDPDAFSRDIRFQVPSFLSTQIGGAPTYPPGGEAWSGFGGVNMFGNDPSQSLTPGQIFQSDVQPRHAE